MAQLDTVMLGGTAQSNIKKLNDNFTMLDREKQTADQVSEAINEKVKGFGVGDMSKNSYDTDDDGVVDQADKVGHALVIKSGSGSTEGKDKYTFDGSAEKTLVLAAGDNIGIITSAGTITFDAADTITKLRLATSPSEVSVTADEQSGAVVLGNAAGRMVSTLIPATPSANEAAALPSLSAVKAYVDALLSSNDAMVFKGIVGTGDEMVGVPTTGYQAGWTYRIGTAGTYVGQACEIGDTIMCVKDYGSAYNAADFIVLQVNIDGAVTSSDTAPVVSGTAPIFNGTTGKLIKGGGHKLGADVPSGAKFTDTVYSIVKTAFTVGDSRWSATATDGEFTLTVPCASDRQPVAVYRNDGGVYRIAMAGIARSSTNALIASYDKFEGYVVMV